MNLKVFALIGLFFSLSAFAAGSPGMQPLCRGQSVDSRLWGNYADEDGTVYLSQNKAGYENGLSIQAWTCEFQGYEILDQHVSAGQDYNDLVQIQPGGTSIADLSSYVPQLQAGTVTIQELLSSGKLDAQLLKRVQ